jgi:hypothetical protein
MDVHETLSVKLAGCSTENANDDVDQLLEDGFRECDRAEYIRRPAVRSGLSE